MSVESIIRRSHIEMPRTLFSQLPGILSFPRDNSRENFRARNYASIGKLLSWHLLQSYEKRDKAERKI